MKVSIIIPVYNVEKYLRKCIDSVLNQTYDNLEIILVNDGSLDQSGEICNEYALTDKRIRVVHKENGGLSSARNAGLDIFTGDYITFIDSDDYVSCDYVEALVFGIQEFDADLVETGFKKVSENEILPDFFRQDFLAACYSNKEAQDIFYQCGRNENFFVQMSWGKLFKKTLFDCLRFPPDKLHEDEFIAHRLFFQSQKSVFVEGERYFYLQRSGSITASKNVKSYLDICEAFVERIKFLAEKNAEEYLGKTLNIYIGLCLLSIRKFQKNKEYVDSFDRQIKQYFVKENYRFFSKKVKLSGKIYHFNRRLYLFLTKIFSKNKSF